MKNGANLLGEFPPAAGSSGGSNEDEGLGEETSDRVLTFGTHDGSWSMGSLAPLMFRTLLERASSRPVNFASISRRWLVRHDSIGGYR